VDNIQYYKTYLQLHSLSQQDFMPQPAEQPELQDWEIKGLPSL